MEKNYKIKTEDDCFGEETKWTESFETDTLMMNENIIHTKEEKESQCQANVEKERNTIRTLHLAGKESTSSLGADFFVQHALEIDFRNRCIIGRHQIGQASDFSTESSQDSTSSQEEGQIVTEQRTNLKANSLNELEFDPGKGPEGLIRA